MIAAEIAPTWNWFDVVVGLAVVWGLFSGVRNGLSGEILRVVGVVAMIVAALKFYIPAGDWLQQMMKLPSEPARLGAFVVIAVAVYAVMVALRRFVHARMKSFKFGAIVENLGGAFAGVARMVVVMSFLAILMSLMRSPFWHQHVSTESRFGAFVVGEFPAVSEVAKRRFEETLWFTRDIKRRDDPSVDETGSTTTAK